MCILVLVYRLCQPFSSPQSSFQWSHHVFVQILSLEEARATFLRDLDVAIYQVLLPTEKRFYIIFSISLQKRSISSSLL